MKLSSPTSKRHFSVDSRRAAAKVCTVLPFWVGWLIYRRWSGNIDRRWNRQKLFSNHQIATTCIIWQEGKKKRIPNYRNRSSKSKRSWFNGGHIWRLSLNSNQSWIVFRVKAPRVSSMTRSCLAPKWETWPWPRSTSRMNQARKIVAPILKVFAQWWIPLFQSIPTNITRMFSITNWYHSFPVYIDLISLAKRAG